ncbi:MAG TPA: SUMF1/EgtB/PvdO family nonheme iron enzyme [Ilumatobacteraceae bacterium]|nr:SUMF1/EgtB/PvdO family nonheme iron enzyme [Ilumatobacteraceae bacterium]
MNEASNREPTSTVAAAAAVVGVEPEADLAGSGALLRRIRATEFDPGTTRAEALVAIVEDPAQPWPRRHRAGLLLAIGGDPRIDTFDPPMIDVPATTYPMGTAAADVDRVLARWANVGVERAWIDKEVPRHTVTVAAFRLGRYPVTNEEYLDFVLATGYPGRPSSWGHGTFPLGAANQPVYTVAPSDADAYCAWLSERTGRHFRLPTEAEWELTATGGDGREYPWGDEWNPARANTAEAGPLTTTPIGIYPEGDSPFGASDMAGNVEEYVSDTYRPYPGGPTVADDLVATDGEHYRVARGGSFALAGDLARCARRHGWYRSPHYAMGFRLAETIELVPAH